MSDRQVQTRAYKAYLNGVSAWDACIGSGATSCSRPAPVAAPTELTVRPAADPARPGQPAVPAPPAITPEQAAYIAYARLRLTPPTPRIGPPPQINQWQMAAVGYPLWLWADGTLDPPAVTDTVEDLTVSLHAHLASVTFDMGDGHRTTCTDLTHPWTPGTTPGAASPTCGYTYTQPSLPRGSYTITAHTHWAVDWAVNGVGGTIPLLQQASTQLPVGELQVLVH